jgi:uncharacterized membrane protein (DUF485 family)
MNKKIISKIIKSKIGIFILQVITLSLFIFGFDYSIPIAFDSGITPERELIIQFLGNYILIDNYIDALFLYGVWALVTLLPIVILNDSRRAFGANLKLLFFPNFFFYLFLSRYSPNYFNSKWLILLTPFLLFAITIIFLSVAIPKLYHTLNPTNHEAQMHELRKIAEENRKKCPTCGAEFDSSPLFCYKCSTRLHSLENENQKEKSYKK